MDSSEYDSSEYDSSEYDLVGEYDAALAVLDDEVGNLQIAPCETHRRVEHEEANVARHHLR